jgi:ABC-type transport system involved in cytochrome c biogenesis permease subunit
VGSGAAALLLLIAPVALPGGDSLEVLVAVLNTNFWLATHVLCITAGYGASIVCACLAHVALAVRDDPDRRLAPLVYRTSLIALLLMAVGTVLGGIWADQSWGRFWGWDPKENGALLICLWLVWAQHGRISGHLDQTGFWIVLAALNVIVALSWFGVNLLSVGLHSYGFTSGMAGGLAAFCALEFMVIATLWVRKVRRA